MGVEYLGTDPDRRPSPKHNGPSVGVIGDPFRRSRHYYESEPERALLTILISLPGVLRIREQRTVTYRLGGVPRRYTFDVIVEWVGGTCEAIAVKGSTDDLRKGDTLEVIRAICGQHGTRVAHDFRLVTYETLDPVAVLNARVIVRYGRDLDHAAQAVVRSALTRLGPNVTLAEIGLATGLGRRGIRAAVALVQSGVLVIPRGERLRRDLALQNRGQGRPQDPTNHLD